MADKHLDFEVVSTNNEPADLEMYRARAAQGWIVVAVLSDIASVTFVPDPNHLWRENTPT